MRKVGVFIPARLGSERLPNKLILPLGESCLFEMACKKLADLPDKFEKIALVENDNRLINIANKYNLKVIIRDPQTAKVDGPLNFIFKDLEDCESTHLMFLNPCLYNLSTKTILDSLETFESSYHEYSTSVKVFKNWLWNMDEKELSGINYRLLNTKLIEPMYQAAHCFHIFNKQYFFEDGLMLKEGHGFAIIPEVETLDVDTYEDMEFAKFKLSKRYVFDFDGVIANTDGMDYFNSKPNMKVIDKINKLFEAGNTIVIQTARGFGSKQDFRNITEFQLNLWGVKYNELYFNKSHADIYVDDKGINSKDFF